MGEVGLLEGKTKSQTPKLCSFEGPTKLAGASSEQSKMNIHCLRCFLNIQKSYWRHGKNTNGPGWLVDFTKKNVRELQH